MIQGARVLKEVGKNPRYRVRAARPFVKPKPLEEACNTLESLVARFHKTRSLPRLGPEGVERRLAVGMLGSMFSEILICLQTPEGLENALAALQILARHHVTRVGKKAAEQLLNENARFLGTEKTELADGAVIPGDGGRCDIVERGRIVALF